MATEIEARQLTAEQEALLARMEAGLKRGDLGPDEAVGEDEELAERAAQHGYTALKDAQQAVKNRNLVRHAFRALGLKPLDMDSVNRYQQAELSRKRRPTRQLVFSRQNLLGFPLGMTFIGAIMASVVALCTSAVPVATFLAYLVPASLVALALLGWINAKDGLCRVAWQNIPLDDYARDLPKHIIREIVAIGERLPQAVFLVEELGKRHELEKTRPDPFLIMRYGQQSYYVDVWLEPDFDGPRVEI